jgi:hypothetical protein
MIGYPVWTQRATACSSPYVPMRRCGPRSRNHRRFPPSRRNRLRHRQARRIGVPGSLPAPLHARRRKPVQRKGRLPSSWCGRARCNRSRENRSPGQGSELGQELGSWPYLRSLSISRRMLIRGTMRALMRMRVCRAHAAAIGRGMTGTTDVASTAARQTSRHIMKSEF